MSHVLYNAHSTFPITVVCERPDWKKCPEHNHLTDKMPKHYAEKQEALVASVENPMYGSEEEAISGVNQAYYSFKTAEAKRERRGKVINAVVGIGSTGLAVASVFTGMFVLALPVIVWGGWNAKELLSKD